MAQLSPGPLSEGHKNLEGIANCTQCHSLGDRVPDQKCLDCHSEIDNLIELNKGYHASTEVKAKSCVDCHSEHHGRKFDLDRFDEDKFQHEKTGYTLKGAHKKIDCRECHKPDNISSLSIRKLEGTFLGMGNSCLDCHDDNHQGTLDNDCIKCHSQDEWKPVTLFDHNTARFKLVGAHQDVECAQCHTETVRNGKPFQIFKDIAFTSCTDCHEDQHNGLFGERCTDCHNEVSWTQLNAQNTFDHNKTDFPLRGLHRSVECKQCHTSDKLTDPIAYTTCKSCHSDYHKGEFTSTNPAADCKDCHDVVKPFSFTLFGFDAHQQTDFKLEGGHAATPCFACHVSEDRWTFRKIGERCVDCHKDQHIGFMDPSYYPNQDCEVCHNVSSWSSISFNHNQTNYALEGKHAETDCRNCHYRDEMHTDPSKQKFRFEDVNCINCHNNIHGKQFEVAGETDCAQCHSVDLQWNILKFNHAQTKFPLEGKHAKVDCSACHKKAEDEDGVWRTRYKIKKFECIDCHSS